MKEGYLLDGPCSFTVHMLQTSDKHLKVARGLRDRRKCFRGETVYVGRVEVTCSREMSYMPRRNLHPQRIAEDVAGGLTWVF